MLSLQTFCLFSYAFSTVIFFLSRKLKDCVCSAYTFNSFQTSLSNPHFSHCYHWGIPLLLARVLIFSRLRKTMVSFRILVSAELSKCQGPKIIWTARVLNLSLFPVSPWAYWLYNKAAATYSLLYCTVGNSYRAKNK